MHGPSFPRTIGARPRGPSLVFQNFRHFLAIAVGILVFAALMPVAVAQPPAVPPPPVAQPETGAPLPAASPGEALTVSLLTFGPGQHPFFKFGHNAILIEHKDGPGAVYNFGMFDFSSPKLIPKFILGRSHYWLGRTERDRTIAQYIEDDRTVEIDRLDLAPAARWDLYQRLEENARPQNREYLYDYFTDNCSTRVRDALDLTVGGRLREAGKAAEARLSYRAHALRLVADVPWEFVALYYALGMPSDVRATRWEEGFIPMELRDLVRTVRLPAADGLGERPMSKSNQLIHRSTQADPPLDPPARLPLFFAVGAALGAICAALGMAGRRARGARIGLGLLSGLLGLLAGLGGLLLVFLWVATNHRACHANANIMQSVPWAIALVVTSIGVARKDPRRLRLAFLLVAAAAGLSLLGLLVRVTGLLAQNTDAFVALFLPIWLGLAFGFRTLLRSLPGPRTGPHRAG
jgi:hypothetical protein